MACHGGPGVERGDIGRGLNPEPPSLVRAGAERAPAELFWIIKNGIKMSGMPSWADHGDDELWDAVSFVRMLPAIGPEQFKTIKARVAERDDAGGADHGGHHHP